MDNSCKAAVSAAVASGYLLGRTKKAKFAFALATYVAGRRFSLSPSHLAAQGLRHLKDHPHLASLRDQVKGELATAARSAMSGSVDRRFSAMAQSLRERTGIGQDAEDQEAADFDEGAEGAGDAEDAEDFDAVEDLDADADEDADDVAAEEEPEPDEESAPEPPHRAGRTAGHHRPERSARRRESHRDAADDEGPQRPPAGKAPAGKRAPGKKASSPRRAAAKTSAPAGKRAARQPSSAKKAASGRSQERSNRSGR